MPSVYTQGAQSVFNIDHSYSFYSTQYYRLNQILSYSIFVAEQTAANIAVKKCMEFGHSLSKPVMLTTILAVFARNQDGVEK